MKVLIVEDDKEIANQLSDYLTEHGFVTQTSYTGEDGQFEGSAGEYDAVLLDIGLPEIDGLSILRGWREDGIKTPVIILTARTSKMETVQGLEAGADDYIHKPFDIEEVVARLRVNIRRYKGHTGNILKYKNVTLDHNTGRISRDDQFIKLTRTEFLMTQYLFLNQGRPISASELAEHAYDDFDNDSGIIARHIANIRKKLGTDVIRTETNRGYYVPLDKES